MQLEIVSPERTLLTADVESVIVPGTDGSFQMLDNHAPIVSTLVKGTVKILGDINISDLIKYHFNHGLEATLTAVNPPGRFGALELKNYSKSHNLVNGFKEKPIGESGWINGGYFVLNSNVFDYIKKGKLTYDSQLSVSSVAASRSPSKLYLEAGSNIKVKDAVNALIIKSANDVATVVAENISGTEKEFAKLMTSYAKNLGMNNTTFKNASGLPNRAQLTTARDIAKLSHALISNFPDEYKLFNQTKFSYKGKTYKTHNKLMLSYEGADGIKTGYIKASGFQLAFSAVRDDKRLIGILFGGDTGNQRNKSLKIIMDKEFAELNITSIVNEKKIVKQESKKIETDSYSIVVGTFKYRNNAEKQIKLIRNKYPVSTRDKISNVVLIKVSGKQLYESRFENFSKKEAYDACKRLEKYDRDCFVRS